MSDSTPPTHRTAGLLTSLLAGVTSWLSAGGAPLVAALVATAVGVVAAAGGWLVNRIESARTDRLELELQATQTNLNGARIALRQTTHLRAMADEANARLAALVIQNERLTQEKSHALAQTTTGRACLGPAAVRVLHGAPGLTVDHLPATVAAAPGADDAAAPAASDPDRPVDGDGPVVTDAGIGQWSIQAGALYEACRARHGALSDYVRAMTSTQGAAL